MRPLLLKTVGHCFLNHYSDLYCSMLLKKMFSVAAIAVACTIGAHAQTESFCGAVNKILADAPNNYANIRGRVMDQSLGAQKWASTVKIPGALGYRIVQAMGLFYEAAFIQTTDKEKLQPVYEEYKKKLSECLVPQGYILSTQENVVAGLGDFPKLVFMKEPEEFVQGTSQLRDLPPHVTMEVLFNKDNGFTIVAFIFNH